MAWGKRGFFFGPATLRGGVEKKKQVGHPMGDKKGRGGQRGGEGKEKRPMSPHAMGYNEVLVAKREVKEKYYVYSYADDFGMKWPENVLFTTEEIIRKYPKGIQQVAPGHYQGFQYAFANRQEAADILFKYNKNLDKAHEIAGMDFLFSIMVTAATKANGLGYVDPAAWEQLGKDLARAGLLKGAKITAAYSTKFASGVKP